MKIVFMGTPDIAVPTLEKLNEIYDIVAVVTTQDNPKGRGLKMTCSPIKEKAIELNLNIMQPKSLKDTKFIDSLKIIKPDIIVVFAFKFLPKEVYNISKLGTFNIHTSLLPKYRGAAPINWAIINGETITGITSFFLNDNIDTGEIILQEKIVIPHNSTTGDLWNIMKYKAPKFAVNTCEIIANGNYKLIKQDEKLLSNAPKLFRNNAKIDWNQKSVKIINFINGYSPEPCAWTQLPNKTKIKIFRANALKYNTEFDYIIKLLNTPGDFYITNDYFIVNCNWGIIEILELQLEGKKRLNIQEFTNGYKGDKQGNLINGTSILEHIE